MALMLAIAGLWLTASSRAYARNVAERNRADAALRESQARFQAIMDHTPLLVFVKDLQGRYTFVNRAAEQWIAATGKPSVGKTLLDIMSAEAAQKAEDVNRRVVDGKAPIQHE